jgi:hypothetical protein
MGVFRNAITETDGTSINVGYLWLFWLGWLDTFLSLFFIVAGSIVMYFAERHAYPFTEVGIAIGAVWGTFSTALGALGLFLLGDRRPSAPAANVAKMSPSGEMSMSSTPTDTSLQSAR